MAVGLQSNGKSKAQSKPVQPKALPVTLLSGFLGSGKTSLLKHILQSDHGLRIAVIVNDVGSINIDASIIKNNHRVTKTEEKVIALQNGCICCTLRGDLLEELVHLAEIEEFDYIIVESSGISEPQQVAETFDSRLAEQMIAMDNGAEGLDEKMKNALKMVAEAGGIDKFARIDTAVTVIDAFNIFNDLNTDQLISARRDDVTPEDERTVSHLMVDQIEFADVIVLNKTDMVNKETINRARGLITKLNRRAKIIETRHGMLEVKQIVNTGIFNLEVAKTHQGWLQDLQEMTMREVNGRNTITPKPETEEYNVRNFVYSRQRPFHPLRLEEFLYDKMIIQTDEIEYDDDDNEEDEEDEDEEEEMEDLVPPPEEEIITNKKNHSILGGLFRSKGTFFLATRPHLTGAWSQAGPILRMEGELPWFCLLPEEEWASGNPELDMLVKHDMAKGGEWGDRRQELVFIGEKLDINGLENLLDDCLLNDEEWDAWQLVMRSKDMDEDEKRVVLNDIFHDGFAEWAEYAEVMEEDASS